MSSISPDVDSFVRRFTTWTNIVLVVLLAVTIAFVLWPGMAGAISRTPPPPQPAYTAGTTIDTPAAWHAESPRTLILFAQASCGACQRAQPFLADLVSRFGATVPVVFVTPGSNRLEEVQFARLLGLDESAVRAAPADIRARVTPTLVLVDQFGVILNAWEGVPPGQQQAILDAITAAAAVRRG